MSPIRDRFIRDMQAGGLSAACVTKVGFAKFP